MSGQVLFPLLLACAVGLGVPAVASGQPRVGEAYGKLPLHFEANRGQMSDEVRFLSRGPGYGLYLTHSAEAVLVLKRGVLRTTLAGAAPSAPVTGLEELPGKANYFIGNDPAKWRSNIPTYAKVQYREVYPGIDLVYYGNQRQLEYDFVVAPGADPQRIVLDFKGFDRLEIDAQGDLILHAAGGSLRQHKPVIYQEIDGIRREIAGGYAMNEGQQIGFQVAAYDKTRPLVIDPVLSYSTYLGGSGLEEGWSIAVDSSGNAYVTGTTTSANFPTTGTALDTTLGGTSDAFVTKLNATGSALVYSTYLGGSASEGGAISIAVDSLGNAYVTGGTTSADFPTTPGAFQTALRGGGDAFITKLNATGSALVYSTYLGGSGAEGGFFRIALDTAGHAYLAGHTDSVDFPITPGAFQPTFVGNVAAYVSKLDPAGSALVYSTYLGGSSIPIGGSFFKQSISIAVDGAGNAHVAGGTTSNTFPTTPGAFQPVFGGGLADAYVTKFDATGSALLYSTYLGGSGFEQAWSIALDVAGNAYVTGFTASADFPISATPFDSTLAGGTDAFVTKLNATGSSLLYSTYLGGSADDQGSAIAVDTAGNAFVTGSTGSLDFPLTTGAFQTTFGGGVTDAVVTKLNAAGSALLYSTYLGGNSNDDGLGIALDTAGNAYATGMTSSANFPTTTGAFQTTYGGMTDAYVLKLAEPVVPPAQTAGKVTGGGSISLTGGIGTFGFNVKRDAAGAPIDGDLQYVNHASGANVHSVTFTTFAVTGSTASFGGTCTNNGAPCTFTVNAADNGEPGRNDSFEITVNAGPAEGGQLRGGNIQVHKQKR